jgi:acetoacetyl-CoA synthetase
MNAVVWTPSHQETTHMWQFLQYVSKRENKRLENYQSLHTWSTEHPELFWSYLCDFFELNFDTPPSTILNQYQHMIDARWFEGATFNFAEKLLSGEPDKLAIISINEAGIRRTYTYKALKKEVARCAEGLKACGVIKGDRVVGFMPNVAETIIAFLASASIGATWSSCSPDFGIQAAVDRLGQVAPKVLFISDKHQYNGKWHDNLDKINAFVSEIPSLLQVVICPYDVNHLSETNDKKACSWDDFLQDADTPKYEPVPFNHPLYILFSSGTTGKPKCIIHSAGGTWLQHVKELGLHTDIHSDDNLFFFTTCGWMMWNWMVSVLSFGATLTLYEGSPTYPDGYRLFELIDKEDVTVFGTSAKFLSSIEKLDVKPCERYKLSTLRCILSTGSPLLPKNYDFVYEYIKSDVQLASISGGTDIVSCFALGNPILPVYRGELQCIGLGMSVKVFNEAGQAVEQKRGELVCTKPFPSMPIGFWDDLSREKYESAYFKRFNHIWAHGDYAEITKHHGLVIYGRSDATLNPGGVRIGTAEIYRQVEKIPQVIDAVVIGQPWEDDVRVVLFVTLKDGLTLDEVLQQTIRQTIRTNASPRHVPAIIIQVPDVPRTINNKVVEIAVRKMVEGEPVNNIQSLANPDCLAYFKNLPELQA